MTLDEFTQITLSVLSEGSIATYAPTLLVHEQVQVIQGIPEGYDHRDAIQEVIERTGIAAAEYCFGVRTGPQEVTTGRHAEGLTEFQRIVGMGKGFTVVPEEACPWWRLDLQGGRQDH